MRYNTRQMWKVDITTGDSITPREIESQFKLMFEDRTLHILAYNLETVLAEKMEGILVRGITNTRMRAFGKNAFGLLHKQVYQLIYNAHWETNVKKCLKWTAHPGKQIKG